MKLRPVFALACGLLSISQAWARSSESAQCGTDRATRATERFLNRQSRLRRLIDSGSLLALSMPSASNNYDDGGIAIVDDADGVVSRRNPFLLNRQTLRFSPVAQADGTQTYRISLPGSNYDSVAAASSAALAGLGDDDTREIHLPFAFPFFGSAYTSAFVNSDGNLTFIEGDSASSDRSLGRMNAGPPRIAPLFSDLDPSRPSGAVRVFADDAHIVISWDNVPVYNELGAGARQSFQTRLFADGSIEFSYAAINLTGSTAVVGIAPGRLLSASEPVSFSGSDGIEVSGGVAEFFSDVDQIDLAVAAQKFYQTHEDSYDYLFFFNAVHLYINNGSVIAFEDTVRNTVTGYGVHPLDDGFIFGSPRRLQAVMNMGPIDQYPQDPYALMPSRSGTGDTGLSVLGHEAGHRFLAWTSVRDESGLGIMWGRSNVHWSFNFDSEASLVEGNRIRDDGMSASPRFTTVATAEGYSPLDQYLFGWRAPEEVPPVFAALDTDGPANASAPHVGTTFSGRRFDITVKDVIAVAGMRKPDSGVAQRNYRFGFVLIKSANDASAPADLLATLANYRAQWTSYWDRISGARATADVQLRRALSASFWPGAELTIGTPMLANVSIAAELDHDLTIKLEAKAGLLEMPGSVMIPAGSRSVTFQFTGKSLGVEEVTLRPEDGAFETVQTRVRVNP